MMKHKWATAESRYAAVSEVDAREFKTSEERDKFIECRALATWKFTAIDRYTTQQLELETQGWTLWSFGDTHPADGLFTEIVTADGDGDNARNAEEFHWVDMAEDTIIAYRLSNADGYTKGVKNINCECGKHMHMTGGNHLTNCPLNTESYIDNDKPEWKAGDLPGVGTVCEWSGTRGGYWIKCEVIRFNANEVVVRNDIDGKYRPGKFEITPLLSIEFRPLQSERDKVIAKANDAIEDKFGDLINDWQHIGEIAEYLYELGMLKAAKESS